MKKQFFTVVLCIIVIFGMSSVAMAKNWEYIPDKDQIQPGDTLYKGDGEIKVFDKNGKLIYKGNKKDIYSIRGIYDNGNFGGETDIWWVYGSIMGYDSGAEGEAATWGYAIPSTDYLYVRCKLYIEDFSSGIMEKVDDENDDIFNDDSVDVAVEDFGYSWNHIMVCDVAGESTHRVEDSAEGWDNTFYTDDAF